MTNLVAWAECADEKIDVEITLNDLGYGNTYKTLVKKIFGINRTPVSGIDATSFMVRKGGLVLRAIKDVAMLSFTHTGQDVYPFGYSSIVKLNRIANSECVLHGSTASNCVSTFKVFDFHLRSREEKKQVVVSCDTVFTDILKEIPSTTVAGDALSVVSLGSQNDGYELLHVHSDTYSQHYAGAWDDSDYKAEYEKYYTSRIVSLLEDTIETLSISADSTVLILPHNVNTYTWNGIHRKLARPKTTVYTDGISEMGHCFGSDAFLNLGLVESEGVTDSLQPNYIICVTAGVGGYFSSIVLSKLKA